jgi:hypothetical protein
LCLVAFYLKKRPKPYKYTYKYLFSVTIFTFYKLVGCKSDTLLQNMNVSKFRF